MPTIQVIVAGFNRCLSVTAGSIAEKVVKPSRTFSSDAELTGIISRTKFPISSEWSGESGKPEYEIPPVLDFDQLKVLEQESLDEVNLDLLTWTIAKRSIVAPVEIDVVTNLLRALRTLQIAGELTSPKASHVLHIRPDLLVHDRVNFQSLIKRLSDSERPDRPGILTPNWGWQPNDKYAFMNEDVAERYFSRIDKFVDFVEADLEFSAENFLRFSLEGISTAPRLNFRASRVRLDGSIKKEDFRRMKFPRPKRRGRLTRLFRRLTQRKRPSNRH